MSDLEVMPFELVNACGFCGKECGQRRYCGMRCFVAIIQFEQEAEKALGATIHPIRGEG